MSVIVVYSHAFFVIVYDMIENIVIIPAGGTGSRLNANLPKQYMLLGDKPVLMHTIGLFEDQVDKIIICIHADMLDYWNQLCDQYQFTIPHDIIIGGKTRFQSVKNAITYLEDRYSEIFYNENSIIAVHDAARPLVDSDLIKESIETAKSGKCNVLAQKSINSIRIGSKEINTATDRDNVWQIQTPQSFPAAIVKEAYSQEESPLFTDDASVVEKIGYPIHLIISNSKNLKITYPEDFEIAKLYMNTIC